MKENKMSGCKHDYQKMKKKSFFWFSAHRENIFLIYGQRKNLFELKKVLLIQKNFLWSKEIDLFTLKKTFLNQQNFLQFKDIFSLVVYQRNVSLIPRNSFLGVDLFNYILTIVKHSEEILYSNDISLN